MKKTRCICIIMAVLLTFGVLSQIASALYPTASPWPMYRHDLLRSGTCTSTAPNTNSTVWTTGTPMSSQPVIVEGMVIYPYGNHLIALNEATGFTLWTSIAFDGYAGTPAISGNVAFVGSTGGTLYAVNINDGSKNWSQTIAPGQIQGSPAVSGRTVYFTTTSNYTYAYDTNGTFLWHYGGLFLAPIYSTPAILGNMLYFGCDNGQVYALNVSGSLPILKWHFNTHAPTSGNRATPCIANGKVYYGSYGDSSLYVLNATTGTLLWKWTTTVSGNSGVSSPAYYQTSPHNLIFINGYTSVYALYADATPGTNYTENDPAVKYWSSYITYGLTNSPVAADGKVFVTQGSNLYALSVTGTGAITWFYKTTYTLVEPAIADGRLFCGNQAFNIFCFGNYFPALTYDYTVNVLGNNYVIQLVIANATPSNQISTALYAISHQLNYTVQGIDGTNGWSNVTVPNALLGGPYTVTVDGGGVVQSVVNNGTYSSIYFTYGQSSHQIIIQGTTILSEFPTCAVLPLLAGLSLIATVLAKKKQRK